MNSNMTTNARPHTNLRNCLNQATSNESMDLAMIFPDFRTSTPISYEHHRYFITFAVNDIPNIWIFRADRHGKKCLTPAFIKATKKYPEQCEQLLNKMYEKRRGPKPACIRQYLKPVEKLETKARGWNLINFGMGLLRKDYRDERPARLIEYTN